MVVIVRGESMLPTLADGQRIVAWRVSKPEPKRGDIIVFRFPQLQSSSSREDCEWLVKRVAAVDGDLVPPWLVHRRGENASDGYIPRGVVAVLGDNPRSLDSRQFGYVAVTDVVAIVHPDKTSARRSSRRRRKS